MGHQALLNSIEPNTPAMAHTGTVSCLFQRIYILCLQIISIVKIAHNWNCRQAIV